MKTLTGWLLLLVAVGFGLIAGWVATKLIPLGVCLLGLFTGFVIALVLN